MSFCEQCDQKKKTDHRDQCRAATPYSGGVDSEGDEIEPIYSDRGEHHICEIVAAAMCTVHHHEAEYANFLRCPALRLDRLVRSVTVRALPW